MTATQYTPEQASALTSASPAVALEAGAGCGKTFVLTERMLAHLDPTVEGPSSVDEVVAITFTDAAAREMRDRVRKKCRDRMERAGEPDRDRWLRLLRSLDAARVSTIHAFCGGLLRTHAVALGLDPAFAVLEQATADVMLSEAVDAHLREALEQQNESVLNLAAEYGILGLKQRLMELFDVDPVERSAWRGCSPSELVAAWKAAGEAQARDVYARFRTADELDELLALLYAASEATAKFALKRDWLLDTIPRVQSGAVGPEALADFREPLKLHASYKKCWPDTGDYERYKQAVDAVKKLIGETPELAGEDELHRAADLGLALLRESVGVADAYAAAKRSANGLDYDDLLRESHRLLTAFEHADVQQSLRREVRLLLVDEFQDTDHLQAEIVRALVGLNGDKGGGRLFFVGDFKQSIYRFRGAEPRVFGDLQEDTPAEGRLPLSTNFRSQPAVLEFVNHVFGHAFGDRYTPLSASRPQVSPTPATELLITAPPDERANAEQKRKSEARAIARRLCELLDSGEAIVAEADATGEPTVRPVRPGDIAILFQSLSDVQHYEQALREQEIEYYLVGGHAFYSQQEVYDVLHLLRSIASSCDEVALAGVLRSPMFAIEDETLYWMVNKAGSLNGAVSDRQEPPQLSPTEAAKLRRAKQVLAELRGMKGRAATTEVLRVAIERTGYDASLLADFLGERKRANLDKLIEQARASDAASPLGAGDIDRFIRQLGEFTLRQPKEALASTTSEGADVVRLMTVHRAKGLEFPVVVVPDLGRKSQPDRRSAAFDRELGPLVKPATRPGSGLYGLDLLKRREAPEDRAESLRKFYVACTRAADYLLLSAVSNPAGRIDGDWLVTLTESYDLETGDSLAGGPSLTIANGDASLVTRQGGGRRRGRLQLVEQARSRLGKPGPGSPEIAPIAVRPESLRQFSVSRLTGKLHHGRDRPEAIALQAALKSNPSAIDPRGLGTLVHAVLERMPAGEPWGRDTIATVCLELAPLHLRRQIDQGAEEAADMVTRFVAAEPWRELASAERFDREVEFLLRWPPGSAANGEPEAWLRGYIDALACRPDGGWRIVDFKTNRVDAEGVQEEADRYRLQLGVYALAVEQARGESPAGMRLCFLHPGVVVDFAWNDAAREQTIELVNQAIQAVRAEAVP